MIVSSRNCGERYKLLRGFNNIILCQEVQFLFLCMKRGNFMDDKLFRVIVKYVILCDLVFNGMLVIEF